MTVPTELVGDQSADEGEETQTQDQSTNETDDENKGAADEGSGDQGTGDGGEAGDEGAGDGGQPEPKLYKLPDGRMVDADTLAKEFQENFLPDYTVKSQKLAKLEANDPSKINRDQEKPDKPWKNPDWVPENSQELLSAAVEKFYEDIQTKADAEKQAREQVAQVVDTQLAEIKAKDPKLDEEALFNHANKYGFTDLKKAHENLQEIKGVATRTEKQVVKNMKTREADPVAGAGDGGAADEGIDYETLRSHGGAMGAVQDYLERTAKK